jgi:hypothetical protein
VTFVIFTLILTMSLRQISHLLIMNIQPLGRMLPHSLQ